MKIKLSILIGSILLVVLSVSYIGVITPIQAQTLEYLDIPINHIEIAPEPVLSLEEHICKASNGQYCELLVNLAKCESTLNPDALHVNTNGTVDIGIFQINSVHQDISNAEKFDVYAATRWAVEKIKAGELHIWVCSLKI